jgi:hypothetical protein
MVESALLAVDQSRRTGSDIGPVPLAPIKVSRGATPAFGCPIRFKKKKPRNCGASSSNEFF